MKNIKLLKLFIVAFSIYLMQLSMLLSAQNQWVNGPNGGFVRELCEHKGEIFAISLSKIFKSNDNAQTWQEIDMSFLGWDRSCLELLANDNYIFVNTTGGLFRSSDAGMSWTLKRANVFRVAIIETTLFLYSSLDSRVYRSQDNGDTWVQKHSSLIDNTPLSDIGKLSFNGDVLFLGSVNAETALYRSGDLGETWEHITEGLIDPLFPQFYVGPSQALFTGSDILLATWLGVYKSTDNGLSWVPALYDEEFGCEKLMKSGDLIIAKGFGHKYWRSLDGTNWVDITNSFPDNVIHSILEQSNTKTSKAGSNIFSGIDGIYVTQDNFNTAQATDNTGLVAWPVEPSQIVACDNYVYATAGGRVYKTNDFGQSWSKIYEGFNLMSKSNDLIFGRSGSGFDIFHFTTDFGATWKVIPTSTNWMAELDGNIFRTTQDGIYKSVDNGNTWVKKTEDIKAYNRIYATETTLFVNCMSPSDQGIHKSTDFGETWTNVGLSDAVGYNWEFLDVNGVLFIGVDYTTPRGVWRSLNNGDTWEHVSVGTKVRRLKANDTKIYMSTYDPSSQKSPLFVSSNNGTSWQQVMDDCLNIFDVDDNYIYVNSFPDHVIKSDNDGATWENISQGHFMFRPRINGINVLNQGLFVGTMKTGYYALSLEAASATCTTLFADDITSNSATIFGSVNPNGSLCTVMFEYGLTTDYGSTVNAVPHSISGQNPILVSALIADLLPNTTYHFRVAATNSGGVYFGSGKAFSTHTVNINEQSSVGGSISPNPFNDYIQLNKLQGPVRLQVTNAVGQLVLDTEAFDKTYVDTKTLPVGFYFFRLSMIDGSVITHKMLKQ
jgi:photosystem II stability/assembly factor-like uncharacterized protein